MSLSTEYLQQPEAGCWTPLISVTEFGFKNTHKGLTGIALLRILIPLKPAFSGIYKLLSQIFNYWASSFFSLEILFAISCLQENK